MVMMMMMMMMMMMAVARVILREIGMVVLLPIRQSLE